jgi:hypothetical protein
MTYDEFKSSAENGSFVSETGGEYLQEVVNNVTENFYNENLVNVDSSNYKAFLEEQTRLIEEGLPIEKKNEIVSAILPVYSEFVSDL